MTDASEQRSIPAKHSGRRIRAACIVAAAIVAMFVLSLAGRHLYYRSKINAELDAIRKAGFPVTLQELSDYYLVPKGDNAADVYSQAFAKYADTSWENDLPVVGEGKLPPRGEPMPKEMQTAVSAYLTSNAQSLDLLHKAATIEGCRYDVDFLNGGVNERLPHLAALHQAARLFQLQALMKLEEGKPDEAAAATAASFAAAHSLRNEPIIMTQFARISVNSTSLATLERVLCRTSLTDKQLTDFSARIAAEEDPEPFVRGMAGERCKYEDLFDSGKWQEIMESPKFPAVWRKLYTISGVTGQSQLMFLKLSSAYVSLAAGTTKELRERLDALHKKVLQVPKSCALAAILADSLSQFLDKELEQFARLRAARAGIAVERSRLANGRLPDSLSELVPKWLDTVPTDPFDDIPIRYKKLTKGFVTYSIGPDLKDDGGKERDPKNPNAPYDITFIVAR